jgi:NAD(P)H-dependent FMN reductase
MKLLIFAASHRPDSLNRKLAKLAQSYVEAKKVTVDFAEYAEFDMPVYNDVTSEKSIPDIAKSFAKRAAKADGIIISSPEYNWSYPGSLKNIIDWTSRLDKNPLAGKTALLMSATPGSRGGISGLQHLKTPLEALRMCVLPRVFPLGSALESLDAKNQFTHKKHQEAFSSILDDYLSFTQKLRG